MCHRFGIDPTDLIKGVSPTLSTYTDRVIEHCLPANTNNQYTLKLKDSHGDSWSAGAFFMIEVMFFSYSCIF